MNNNSNNSATMNDSATHCTPKNFTDRFGMLEQVILAFLAFSFLIIKRLREPKDERRPWKIWFYDTSKQALGAGLIHVINILLSMVSLHGDACTWYVIYFLLDSTAGLLFIWIQVKLSQCVINMSGCKSLRFGEYGEPPKCDAWIGQCAVFIIIVIVEKLLVTLLTQIPFWTELAEVLLSPIHNPKAELTLVMLIIPFIVNTIMFWVVDNFLMGKRSKVKGQGLDNGHERSPRVHYHSVPAKTSDSESEVLISYDEDEERPRPSELSGSVVQGSSPGSPVVKRAGEVRL